MTLAALAAGHGDWAGLALPTGRTGLLLARSLGLAAGVAVGGLGLGLLAATALSGWHGRGGRYARWLLVATATLPPYVHAMAWKAALTAANGWLLAGGLAPFPLRGWLVSWWVQTMALLPLAVGLALVGLATVDGRLVEAGRVFRPDLTVWRRIVGPLAAPAVGAGMALLFLLALTDYTAPSLFATDTYPFEVFAEYSANNEPARAFLLALPLLLATLAVLAAFQAGFRRVAAGAGRGHGLEGGPPVWPNWFSSLQVAALVAVAAQVLVPLGALGGAVASWADLAATAIAAGSEFWFTLAVAAVTAVAALPLGLLGARGMRQEGRRGQLWCLLVSLPLAVPAPLVGIGLIAIHSRLPGAPLYGTVGLPVLAGLARFASFAAVVILAQMRRLDPQLTEAALVHQRHPWQGWWRVRLPLLAPGLAAAAAVTFALTAGELGATLIVAPPGWATLTMRLYNYLHYGSSTDVGGLGLMMAALTLIPGLAAVVVLSRRPAPK